MFVKLSIMSFIGLVILTGCFSSVPIVSAPVPPILNCKETWNVMNFLTPKTALAFNGTEAEVDSNFAITFCESNQVVSKLKCAFVYGDKLTKCMLTLGIQAKDVRACHSNVDCLIAYASSHIEDCNRYDIHFMKNACLYGRSFFSQEIKYCDEIEEKNIQYGICPEVFKNQDKFMREDMLACSINRYKCLWGVSDWTDNVEICDSMDDSSEKDVCYFSHAVKKGDRALCKKMNGSYFKEQCAEVAGKSFPEKYQKYGLLGTEQ